MLVVTSSGPDGLPHCEIRAGERAGAVAGINWQSPRFAEVYVYTEPAVRGRGWGKSVVQALVGHILKAGRLPLYVVAQTNEYSIRLAENVGFVNTGQREYVGVRPSGGQSLNRHATFPESVLWGTATAGYQTEGQRPTPTIGSGNRPPVYAGRARSGVACDWWNGRRWAEDFDRAAADGHTALRLSVEWRRVSPSPTGGRVGARPLSPDGAGPAPARPYPDGDAAPLCQPAVGTEPDRHSWETGEAVALFERYTRKVATALGEYVDLWCTINEPNVFMVRPGNGCLAAGEARFWPGAESGCESVARPRRGLSRPSRDPAASQVGMPIHFGSGMPAQPGFALDEWAARTQFSLFSALFSDAVATGRLRRPLVRPVSVPEAQGTQDFIAIQYYTGEAVRFDPRNPGELFGRRTFPPEAEVDGGRGRQHQRAMPATRKGYSGRCAGRSVTSCRSTSLRMELATAATTCGSAIS